ncbi:hypothetical protein R1sor_007976 [Riccia sorocarpa]|uniref:Uncharacterized protein n=1 Tax=Riccia sorocarpa TaxID=122646 RepID=A0ABD3HW45_9MARC
MADITKRSGHAKQNREMGFIGWAVQVLPDGEGINVSPVLGMPEDKEKGGMGKLDNYWGEFHASSFLQKEMPMKTLVARAQMGGQAIIKKMKEDDGRRMHEQLDWFWAQASRMGDELQRREDAMGLYARSSKGGLMRGSGINQW